MVIKCQVLNILIQILRTSITAGKPPKNPPPQMLLSSREGGEGGDAR
jgi:hypothetical protein